MTNQTQRIHWTLTELMALRDPFMSERAAGRNSHDALRTAQSLKLPKERWRAVNGNSIRSLQRFIDNDPTGGIVRDILQMLKRAGVRFVVETKDGEEHYLNVNQVLRVLADRRRRVK
jgi:hypothetical protein